jgi:chondroitin AC lyase
MKLNVIKNQGRFAAVWFLCFLVSFTVARADDFATIQNNLLVSTSAAWVPISYAGLKTLNPTTYEDCLDVTQAPTQAQVTDAMTIDTSTGLSAGLYADIVYTKTGGKPEYRMNHFRRLLILGLAYRNKPDGYSQTSTAIKTALIKGLTAWVNFFSTSLNGTAFQDSVIWAPGFYPNSYGAVVLLVPDLIKANTTLWAKSIAYLTQYYHIDNTFAANAQAPYRARLMGYVLSGNTTAAAELTENFIRVELGYSSRQNDVWSVPSGKAKQDLVEGFHPDYSFQQHSGGGRTNYWGHYGEGFVGNMPALLRLTSGTAYTLKSAIPFLSDAIVNGLQWNYYSYSCRDLQSTGRWYENYYTLQGVQDTCDQLAAIAGTEGFPAYKTALLEVSGRIKSTPTTLRGDRMFYRADYHVHRGNGWGTSVRMSSKRTVACESGDGDGINNHYTGSGALYLVQTGSEYKKGVVSGDTAHPTSPYWNWRRLPGITVEQYPKTTTLPEHLWGNDSNGGKTFAGGASDGTYGVVGYQHYLADTTGSQPVTAYKAAFFFDNEYVMAGAGITQANGSYSVVTTINQTKLVTNTGGSAISYYAGGVQTDLPLTASAPLTTFPSGGAWVLSGNTGYVFPVSGSTYSFQQFYTSASVPPVDTGLFWLGIDHGKNPTNKTYFCIVRPNSNETDLANYVANPDIVMAANTKDAQGVFGPNQVFQAIYYIKGGISGTSWLRTVEVDQPCALILRPDSVTAATKLLLTVSNPQCESVAIPTVSVKIKTTYNITGSVNNGDGTYTLTQSVALPYDPGDKGKSITINLPLEATLAPVISGGLTATATTGQPFRYPINASNIPTNYSATPLPAGLSVEASSGIISGTPTSAAGTYIVTIGASNAGGLGRASLKITVLPPAPVITSSLTATAIIGQAFSYPISASNSPTSYSATGLPAGLSVDTFGKITGTPTSAAGQYTVTIGASNAGGLGTAILTITVVTPITALESVPPTLTIAGSIAELRVGNSVKGHWYQLQRTTDLSGATVWENIGTPQPGNNGVLTLKDDSGMTGPRVFYRLQISVTAP